MCATVPPVPKRGIDLPRLGELELEVLEHLWRVGEADVNETHQALGAHRTANTVGSALERLHKKKLLERTKVSHAYRYTPVLSKEELTARRVLALSGGKGALSQVGLLSAFVDLVAEVDEDLLDRLDALVAAKREGRDS